MVVSGRQFHGEVWGYGGIWVVVLRGGFMV